MEWTIKAIERFYNSHTRRDTDFINTLKELERRLIIELLDRVMFQEEYATRTNDGEIIIIPLPNEQEELPEVLKLFKGFKNESVVSYYELHKAHLSSDEFQDLIAAEMRLQNLSETRSEVYYGGNYRRMIGKKLVKFTFKDS